MKRAFPLLLVSALTVVLGLQSFTASAAVPVTRRATYTVTKPPVAAAKKVVVSGKTYYIVEGNTPALDTGNEACASVGLKCTGYTNLSSNAVCMAAHPGAKQLVSVNGSKNGFYCDGSPQTGLACATYKNTCEVCPACNVNANCATAIGTQFREMFVTCGAALASSSSVKSSSSSVSSVAVAGKKCAFKQGTVAGGRVITTCNVRGAPDNFCIAAFGGLFPSARSIACAQNGEVVCNIPCSAPGVNQLTKCPLGATTTAPTGSCSSTSTSTSTASTGKVPVGGLCKHGGECETSWGGKEYFVHCVGFTPAARCSCNMFSQTTGGCKENLNNLKNGGPGARCVHGGNCLSGMCLGTQCK